jgi:hypothetical protein
MNILIVLVAFAGSLLATSRSLGWGFLAVFAVGYFNGVARANFLSVYTTFMFDSAVLGLYLGSFSRPTRVPAGFRSASARSFVLFLIAWPALLTLVPINNILVQFVALRSTVWFLPALLIATRLTASDLAVMARGLAVLNLLALAVGIYLYQYGVEALYPKNAVTVTIFMSNDVAGHKYHRIPSTFLNAHSYGGTMLFTLPLLLDRLAGVGVRMVDRGLAAAGVVAAAGGLLMCGARTPMVQFAVTLAVAWVLSRLSLVIGLIGAVLVGCGLWVASSNERFQRSSTLGDTEYVTKRIATSANASFLELLRDYPMGAGMGSAFGTSIPYFLADVAPEAIGMENELSRILIDQGWVGLGGWLAFVGWLYARPPSSRPPAPWRLGVSFMYSVTLSIWMTALIGAGTLSSIPGSILLLTQMGVLVVIRENGAVPGTASPRPVNPVEVHR